MTILPPQALGVTRLSLALAGMASLFIAGCAAVQRAPERTPVKDKAREIGEYADAMAAFGYWGAIALVEGDSVVVRRVSGWANRERQTPLTDSSVFYLASVSKQFTAALVLRLEELGRLRVSDPISKYLDGVPADTRKITIQLLTHSSGVVSTRGGRECMSRSEAVDAILSAPLTHQPGTEYRYTNAGYALVAAIIEQLTGEQFEANMRRYLWEPVGMRSTGFMSESGRWPATHVAHGYNIVADYGAPYAPRCQWNRLGAGSTMSTLDDLIAWMRALRDGTLLTKASVARLWTPYESTGEGYHYGYGWEVDTTTAGTRVLRSRGDLLPDGHNSGLFFYPDHNAFMVLLNNRAIDMLGQTYSIETAVGSAIGGIEYTHPPRFEANYPAGLEALTGRYEAQGRAGAFIISVQPEGLVLEADGQSAINAVAGRSAAGQRLAKLEERNRLSDAIVRAAATNDSAALKRLLGSADAAETVTARWAEGPGRYGHLAGFRSLGTVPRTYGEQTTYVSLDFGEKAVTYRIWWDQDGRFVNFRDEVQYPEWTVLRSAGDNRFVGHDIVRGTSVSVEFGTQQSDGRRWIQVSSDGQPGLTAWGQGAPEAIGVGRESRRW